ncbi:hypothetical protein JCM3770_000015 [Rhodotorula araucariae]
MENEGGARRRRKKLPRKKLGKDSESGWEDDHVERATREEDEGQYDADVPYDLRLLRCCGEFRSLRSLGHLNRKVNREAVLRYLQANVVALREKRRARRSHTRWTTLSSLCSTSAVARGRTIQPAHLAPFATAPPALLEADLVQLAFVSSSPAGKGNGADRRPAPRPPRVPAARRGAPRR